MALNEEVRITGNSELLGRSTGDRNVAPSSNIAPEDEVVGIDDNEKEGIIKVDTKLPVVRVASSSREEVEPRSYVTS